jgi:hypothetical protein
MALGLLIPWRGGGVSNDQILADPDFFARMRLRREQMIQKKIRR